MKKVAPNGSNGSATNGASRATHSRTPSDEDSNKENKVKKPVIVEETAVSTPAPAPAATRTISDSSNVELRKKNPFLINDGKKAEPAAAPAKRPVSQRVFGRISKFKHLKGEVILKGRFENLKNLSRTCPAECDFVHGKETLSNIV